MSIQIGAIVLLGIIAVLLGILIVYARKLYPFIRKQHHLEISPPHSQTPEPQRSKQQATKQAYSGYLQSESWKKLREAAISRAKSTCELCGAPYKAIHHIKYPANYEHDTLENLIVVCGMCHEKLHGGREEIQGGAQQELLSEKIMTRTRTYFLDVKFTSSHEKYLQITEAKKRDNDVYEYYRMMIFEEDILKFYQSFQKVLTDFKKEE